MRGFRRARVPPPPARVDADIRRTKTPASRTNGGRPARRARSARCAGRPGARRSSLLRGESLDLLARESGQPAGRIAAWREEFLAGREGLKARPAEPTIARSPTPSARSASRRWRSTSCGRSWRRRGTLSRRGARSERAAARTGQGGLSGGRRFPVGGAGAAPPPSRSSTSAPAASRSRSRSPPSREENRLKPDALAADIEPN